MALLNDNLIDDSDVQDAFQLIEPGEYTMQITGTNIQPNNVGNGEYVKLSIKVYNEEGSFYPGTIFEYLNIVHPNEQTVNIARSELKRYRKACNLPKLEDTDELIGIPFMGTVIIQEGTKGYNDNNKVKNPRPYGQCGQLEESSGKITDDVPWEE